MRRMTRYEQGQIVAYVAVLLMVGLGLLGGALWTYVAQLACLTVALVFHTLVTKNWRGILDEQIIHEQDQAMADQRSYPPGAAQRRRALLQRGSQRFTIMFGLLFGFFVVFIVLQAGGWL